MRIPAGGGCDPPGEVAACHPDRTGCTGSSRCGQPVSPRVLPESAAAKEHAAGTASQPASVPGCRSSGPNRVDSTGGLHAGHEVRLQSVRGRSTARRVGSTNDGAGRTVEIPIHPPALSGRRAVGGDRFLSGVGAAARTRRRGERSGRSAFRCRVAALLRDARPRRLRGHDGPRIPDQKRSSRAPWTRRPDPARERRRSASSNGQVGRGAADSKPGPRQAPRMAADARTPSPVRSRKSR